MPYQLRNRARTPVTTVESTPSSVASSAILEHNEDEADDSSLNRGSGTKGLKLGWSSACVGLEEHRSGDVVTIILGREDGFITGPVLDKHKEKVVWSGHGLGFGRGVELKLELECAIDVL